MADTFDVVIIGSGPGGYVAAIRAGQLGLKTAIIEKDKRLGGTCLHRGCIPTKALLYTSELYSHILHAAEFGINTQNPSLDWAKAQQHKQKVVDKSAGGVDFLMKKNKVTVFKGVGKIAGKGKVDFVATEGGAKQLGPSAVPPVVRVLDRGGPVPVARAHTSTWPWEALFSDPISASITRSDSDSVRLLWKGSLSSRSLMSTVTGHSASPAAKRRPATEVCSGT